MYVLDGTDNLHIYETNAMLDEEAFKLAKEKLEENGHLFTERKGGFGNYVFIKNGIDLEIDDKYECFWYHAPKTKLRIDCSVKGVFMFASADIRGIEVTD